MMTTSKFVTRATLLMLSAISLSAGCGQERVVAPGGAGGVPEFKGPTAGEGGKQPPSKVDAYLAEKKALAMIGPDGQKEGSRSIKPYEWFTAEPAGAIGAEMMPVILLRILPDLAVEFGEKDPEESVTAPLRQGRRRPPGQVRLLGRSRARAGPENAHGLHLDARS